MYGIINCYDIAVLCYFITSSYMQKIFVSLLSLQTSLIVASRPWSAWMENYFLFGWDSAPVHTASSDRLLTRQIAAVASPNLWLFKNHIKIYVTIKSDSLQSRVETSVMWLTRNSLSAAK